MRFSKSCFAVAAFVFAAGFSSVAIAQSDADKAAARQLATQGAQALSANKYADALDLVTRAEAMFHAPTHLAMIARAQGGLGHYVAAREAYIKLSREELAPNAPAAFKAAVDDARAQLPVVEAKIANLRIVVHGGEGKKVTVKLDEQPVAEALIGVFAPVDPGKHDVSISTGGPPTHAGVDLVAGEKKDITLEAPAGGDAAPPGRSAGCSARRAVERRLLHPGPHRRPRGRRAPASPAPRSERSSSPVILSGKSSAQTSSTTACNPGCTMPTKRTRSRPRTRTTRARGRSRRSASPRAARRSPRASS